MRRKLYRVMTWDARLGAFTPQQGIRCGPYTLWGLKRALRRLQACGYPCHRTHFNGDIESDPSVLVSRWRRSRKVVRP